VNGSFVAAGTSIVVVDDTVVEYVWKAVIADDSVFESR
jgi:hypothetical protein